MTHNDIYTKFLIQYDKAGEATSYPSLTEYEIATFLDKAYDALIAQKVTGNNYRRAGLEADLKVIADLNPLVHKVIKKTRTSLDYAYTTNVNDEYKDDVYMNEYSNCRRIDFTDDDKMLYFVQASILPPNYATSGKKSWISDWSASIGNDQNYELVNNLDLNVLMPIKLIDHSTAQKFIKSAYNIPWIKQPVGYLENNSLYVITDPLNTVNLEGSGVTAYYNIDVRYIKKPNTFVKNLDAIRSEHDLEEGDAISFFSDSGLNLPEYQFECNSTVAEELVSLAVSFALENVESQRLNSKLNMRGLEA